MNLPMLLKNIEESLKSYEFSKIRAERDRLKINYDSMMDALSQCHNLFEAEYEDLSDQGKRVHQSVIVAILKATHKT